MTMTTIQAYLSVWRTSMAICLVAMCLAFNEAFWQCCKGSSINMYKKKKRVCDFCALKGIGFCQYARQILHVLNDLILHQFVRYISFVSWENVLFCKFSFWIILFVSYLSFTLKTFFGYMTQIWCCDVQVYCDDKNSS